MSAFVTVIALSGVHRRVPLAVGACLVSFAGFWIAQRAAHVSMIDLMVYRAEGETVRAGGDLYALRTTEAHLPSTYPPLAALLFTPLAFLNTTGMRTLATVGNLALLVAFTGLCLRLVGTIPHVLLRVPRVCSGSCRSRSYSMVRHPESRVREVLDGSPRLGSARRR